MPDPSANTNNALPLVELYTDGACSGNPGPGGWAYILRHPATGKSVEACGRDPSTTNNRMEIMAALQGLLALRKPSRVTLCSDSKYVVQAMTEWMANWEARGWRKGPGAGPLRNADLWQQLAAAMRPHTIVPTWTRGHAGHAENERCDQLAAEQAQLARLEALRR